MTEQEFKAKLDELDKEVIEIWHKSFDREDGWDWYRNHPKTKEFEKLYREYKLIKTPTLNDMDDLDKQCRMSFKDFEEGCKVGPFFSDYDGTGRYATKDKVSDIGISPSDIVKGVYRKDFDYICWYNK